jgi:hypothetical protein
MQAITRSGAILFSVFFFAMAIASCSDDAATNALAEGGASSSSSGGSSSGGQGTDSGERPDSAGGGMDGSIPTGQNYCANFASAPMPSGSTVRFISPTGSNSADGLTVATAWANAANVTSGQTAVFKGGNYPNFPVIAAGSSRSRALSNVIFMAAPGEKPILSGGYYFAIGFDADAHHITVRGLSFVGYSANETGVVTVLQGSHHWTVECSSFKDIGATQQDHAIYPGGGTPEYLVVRGNRFENVSGGGVHSYHANGLKHAEIYDNVFVNCKWGVIVCHEGQTDWDIHHNSFYNTASPGVMGLYLSAYSETPVATANIRIHHNAGFAKTGVALRVDALQAGGVTQESDNVWFAENACPYAWGVLNPADGPTPCQRTAGEASSASSRAERNVFANPGWTNPDARDFTAKAGSAAATLGAGARF